MVEHPLIGGTSGHDGADVGDEIVVRQDALLPTGLRQQPVQAVALIGDEAVEGRRGVVAIAGHERSPVLLRCHRIGSGSRCVVSMPASESIQRASSRRWVEWVSSWARIWESRKDSGGSHSA